jgi:hypothetical protein
MPPILSFIIQTLIEHFHDLYKVTSMKSGEKERQGAITEDN